MTRSGHRLFRTGGAFAVAVVVAVVLPFVSRPASAANPSGDLDQCANGGVGAAAVDCAGAAWQNGNLNASQAHYGEGDSVPYRVLFANLSTTGTHTATVEWDTTRSGKHAFDYLTSFEATETTANPCSGVAGCVLGARTTFPIPADPNIAAAPHWAGTQVPGAFSMWNGAITAVSAYTVSGAYSGTSSTRVTVTFTAATGNPVLAWGGHIATRLDWGAANSAVSISGSPYHMRLLDVDGTGGNQDRSLNAGAVVFPGTITVRAEATPDTSMPFPFTATGGLASPFTVGDGGAHTFPAVAPGTYAVTEVVPPGWSLVSLVCTGATVATSTATATASITLAEAQNAVCTFTNAATPPTITVTKTPSRPSVPEPGADVTFAVVVANGSPGPVTLFELEDSVYGAVADSANGSLSSTTCTVPRTIAAGATTACSFTATVYGNGGDVEVNTVTARARDDNTNVAEASASATVTVTDVLPDIAIVQAASATSVPVGTTVTYTYGITTSGPEPLLAVAATDQACGPLVWAGGDADGDAQLDPGETWQYTCTVMAVTTATTAASATARDDEGNVARATDAVTVAVLPSAVAIDKQATPESTTPGGTIVYTYDVTNPGGGPLREVVVVDDTCTPVVFTGGDAGDDAVLAPGETWRYSCTFVTDATVSSLTNVGTVTATDAAGAVVTASDVATISIVAGAVFERPALLGVELPQTGGAVRGWAGAGALLVAVGAALSAAGGRRRRRPVAAPR